MNGEIKKWYINFLESKQRGFIEKVFYCFLYLISFIYGLGVKIRNFSYDQGILPTFSASKKVISIGNLSWSGSGKTSLAIYLYEKFAQKFKVAILRRGYGDDEGKLLQEKVGDVFSSPNRVKLAQELAGHYDLFILDDGFQYRKLTRDLDIVIMGAREFDTRFRLLPASFFRESLSSLKRAQMLVINYRDEITDYERTKRFVGEKFPHLNIFFSRYIFKTLLDLEGNEVKLNSLKAKKLAALTAIGYPQGFLNKLKELNLNVVRDIIYPDHYEPSEEEFNLLQSRLIHEGITDIIVTAKDKYRIPKKILKVHAVVMEVEMEIEEEERFLREVYNRIAS